MLRIQSMITLKSCVGIISKRGNAIMLKNFGQYDQLYLNVPMHVIAGDREIRKIQ